MRVRQEEVGVQIREGGLVWVGGVKISREVGEVQKELWVFVEGFTWVGYIQDVLFYFFVYLVIGRIFGLYIVLFFYFIRFK